MSRSAALGAAAVAAPVEPTPRRRSRMKPLTPVSPGARVALGVSFFVLFVAVWVGGHLQRLRQTRSSWPTR